MILWKKYNNLQCHKWFELLSWAVPLVLNPCVNSHTYSKIVVVRGGGGGGSHLSTHTGNTRINACKDLKKTGKELISIYGNSSSGISNSISSMRFCFSFSVSGLCLAALPCNKIYLKHSDKILICFYANIHKISQCRWSLTFLYSITGKKLVAG